MSVDYSLRFCYGVIIPEEVMDKMYETLDVWDELLDDYATPINAWTGGDYFFGYYTEIDEDDNFVVEINEETFKVPEHLNEFVQFYKKNNLSLFFEWKPKRYLINFCY